MDSQGSILKADVVARKKRQNRAFQGISRTISATPRLDHLQATHKAKTTLTSFSFASRKILFRTLILVLGITVITGINPPTSTIITEYSYDYISSYGVPGDILVLSDDGYLLKVNPQTTNQISRAGMTDFAIHIVESGEVLSLIAERYGVSVNSIMWANKLTNPNTIKIGQKLLVPPVSGVPYEVQEKDTLQTIAQKYEISIEDILTQNGLGAEATLAVGQKLILPGAKPTSEDLLAGNYGSYSSGKVIGSVSTPSGGKIFIMPTTGRISQGFNSGHYAYDIANRNSPAIWAAGSGKVIKVAKSGWNGGYGNYLIIDHGNGYQTLYAHLARIDVNLGTHVSQGEVLGIMGTTGRSTGIHLHFEVRINGVKKNPGLYY